MPEGVQTKAWQETELGQLGSFSRGRGGTRADEDPNGLPCIRYGDLYTYHNCIVRSFASSISPSSASSYTPLQPGDVVFAGSGETFEDIGKAVAYCHDSPAYAGADTIVFRPGPRLLPQFAGYALNSDCANAHKSRMGQGSSVIHIGAEHLSRMRLRLPPVEQQKRIAEILSTVDEAIEQTEALIAKTQHIKAGLMHDLFTRGVTADGQLRPTCEEAPHLYKESPLGWIPKEWAVVALREHSLSTPNTFSNGPFGSDLLSTELRENGVPVLYVQDVKPDGFRKVSLAHVTENKADELAFCNVRQGDVLVAKVGTPPGDAAVYEQAERAIVTQDVIRIRPAPDSTGAYVSGLLNSSVGSAAIRRIMIEGTRGRVSLTDFKQIPVPKPSLQEQQLVAARLGQVLVAIDSLASELSKLGQVKRALMQDLLTGRVQLSSPAVTISRKGAANV